MEFLLCGISTLVYFFTSLGMAMERRKHFVRDLEFGQSVLDDKRAQSTKSSSSLSSGHCRFLV